MFRARLSRLYRIFDLNRMVCIVMAPTRASRPDDSWIYATFARNLATGHGYSFNPGEDIWGATGPLYVFLLALLYWGYSSGRGSGRATPWGSFHRPIIGVGLRHNTIAARPALYVSERLLRSETGARDVKMVIR